MDNTNVDGDINAQMEQASWMLDELVQTVQARIHAQLASLADSGDVEAQEQFTRADPERWLENARNSLQSGLMFLARANHQPPNF
ncbi:hypothetical protein [Stenotrophomonas maltophilia]|uniref:hypothetical protein n=1 Tax=Stenotrophomonas maltophilia TaxID=40324 RepID=UPI002B1DA98D|nr:hypothetical protein [Stenotrophomonas maltophilia]